MNNTNITGLTVTHNNGGRIYGMLVLSGQITSFYSTYTLIYNTSFTDIRTSMRATTGDANSMPAVFLALTVYFTY